MVDWGLQKRGMEVEKVVRKFWGGWWSTVLWIGAFGTVFPSICVPQRRLGHRHTNQSHTIPKGEGGHLVDEPAEFSASELPI